MTFASVTAEIARDFHKATLEPIKEHPMVKTIERHWRDALRGMMGAGELDGFQLSSSAGTGRWNSAPWLAVFDAAVTRSARVGYYPVYLFEPGFKTVCLVMGQGAASLEEAVGRQAALEELARRASILRARAIGWEAQGFVDGPFATLRRAAVGANVDAGSDPWSVSAAFGKRYKVDAFPTEAVMAADLEAMLQIYSKLVSKGGLDFAKQDDELLDLKQSGELPKGTVDGAKKVLQHKKFEIRVRSSKLIAEVKENLGYTCAACSFKFGDMYGGKMAKYIEAHHLVPLSSVDDEGVKLTPTAEHFAVLCSNCHRAIHAAGCPGLDEPPRVSRRLNTLRGLSHEQVEQVLARGA